MALVPVLNAYSFTDESNVDISSTTLNQLANPKVLIKGIEDRPIRIKDASKLFGAVGGHQIQDKTVTGRQLERSNFYYVDEREDGSKFWRSLDAPTDYESVLIIKNKAPHWQRLGDSTDPLSINVEDLKGPRFYAVIATDPDTGRPVFVVPRDSGVSFQYFDESETKLSLVAGIHMVRTKSAVISTVVKGDNNEDIRVELKHPYNNVLQPATPPMRVLHKSEYPSGFFLYIQIEETADYFFSGGAGVIYLVEGNLGTGGIQQ